MRILVIGAGGFIGPFLARHLQAAGHVVVGLSHSPPADMSGLSEHLAADREDVEAIERVVRTRSIDAAVDLLAFTEVPTIRLLDSLDNRVTRYLLASSGDVYCNYGSLLRKERGRPALEVLNEDAPLRTGRFPYRGEEPRSEQDSARWLDDYDKIPVEENVIARKNLDWTILRLPMVFGPGDRQRRFSWIIRPLAAGVDWIAVPPAWAAWRTSYGYVEDVAAGIALAATHSAASRRTFNLGMAHAPTHADWIARFAAAMNWQGEIRDDLDPASPLNALTAGLDLSCPLVLGTQRIRSELAYREVVDAQTALARTVGDELQREPITPRS